MTLFQLVIINAPWLCHGSPMAIYSIASASFISPLPHQDKWECSASYLDDKTSLFHLLKNHTLFSCSLTICFGFLFCCSPARNNSDRDTIFTFFSKGMDHNQQPSFSRNTHSDPSVFSLTMVWIKYGKCFWIFEYRCSFVKRYIVFISIIVCFVGIPLKIVIYSHFQHSFGFAAKPYNYTASAIKL